MEASVGVFDNCLARFAQNGEVVSVHSRFCGVL
jgi:hypothetical protein